MRPRDRFLVEPASRRGGVFTLYVAFVMLAAAGCMLAAVGCAPI
jgi:hypothetical protein